MPRVLSIQSHVVSGYVGNKCAQFPLQLLGFDVDPVMSVHFANHTGYPTVKGTRMDGSQLEELIDALSANALLRYSHVLTGYIGSKSFLRSVVGAIERVRAANPAMVYVCDPVLGDEGKLYVPDELVDVYRDAVVPLAHAVTPNHFELELLTGLPVQTVENAARACQALHDRGVSIVIVTSMADPHDAASLLLIGSVAATSPGRDSEAGGQVAGARPRQVFSIAFPRLHGRFTGTGDLFAALFLARLASDPSNVASATEQAVATLQAVMVDTDRQAAYEAGEAGGAGDGDDARLRGIRSRELRIVQNAAAIMTPNVQHEARRHVEY